MLHPATLVLLCVGGPVCRGMMLVPPPQIRGGAGAAMTLCGQDLSEARLLFCTEAGLLLRKRPALVAHADWPKLEPLRDNSLVGSKGKRGIVDECCYKPCFREELLTYC